MEWTRAVQAACVLLLGTFTFLGVIFFQQTKLATPSPAVLVSEVGQSPSNPVAYRELNRERRARELVHPYPFYTISPRYYYQNSPYHQSRYSYYDGFNYFYPNYGTPSYYSASPYTVGLSLDFDQDASQDN